MRPLISILVVSLLATPALASDPPPLLASWGGPGSGPGQFSVPSGIAVSPTGNVYVVDLDNCRVQYFTESGTYLGEWGTCGRDPGQFQRPAGIAIDRSGNVYITDNLLSRVQKFTSAGEYLATFANEHIDQPSGMAVDPAGNLYVGNLVWGEGLGKFDSSGQFLMALPAPRPWRVSIDSHGCVCVSNGIPCIQRFVPDGTLAAVWGCSGSFPEDMTLGLAVDDADNILFIRSFGSDLVLVCNHDLEVVDFWSPPRPFGGLQPTLGEIAIGPPGVVYLTDSRNDLILKLAYAAPVPTVRSTWGELKDMYR